MKTVGSHNYIVYIVTNKNKTVLYTGVTNSIERRLLEHEEDAKNFLYPSFAGHYNAHHLLYYERFEYIEDAIAREKEIKGWSRNKKENLINIDNPDWRFLNDEIE
jgi:putative endonuclease